MNAKGKPLEGFHRSVGQGLEYLAYHRCLINSYRVDGASTWWYSFPSQVQLPLFWLSLPPPPELDPSHLLLEFSPALRHPPPGLFAPSRAGKHNCCFPQ